MSAKTVFISYSHKDEPWKHKLLPHLHALEQAGVEMKIWHDRKIDGGDKWYPEIQDAMADAAVAVLLISADFLASGFCVKEEVPFLLDRQEKEGMLLLPVLVRECTWEAHRWLAARQMLPRDGKCVALNFPGDLADTVFAEIAKKVYLHFTRLASKPQTAPAIPASVQKLVQAEVAKIPVKASEPPPVAKTSALFADRLDLTRLPETGSALFGRDEELKLLDAAWSDDSTSRTRVLAFKAHGGVGKSTLINHWLGEMKRDNFRGATRVFGWSFYSQGVREQGPASADTFVAAALKFFGDEAMAASPASAWDKGERLARLVGAERALLVLDGMEPLQSAQAFDRGKLRDPALESMLRGLAKQSAGLCLITTRESLPDMAKKPGFAERDLEQITSQAGRALLRTARVVGTDAELESLAQRFGPHALAISLLGVYLHEQPGRGVGPAQKLEQMPGKRPVDRVLAGFEQWLGDSGEREVLHLLGLFDRPADAGCLKALRTPPAIPGLTDRVTGRGDAEWDRVLTRLDKLRLIHTRQSDSSQRFVDAHPLVREHFAEQLREKNLEAWRAAHRRLYEHLCATTKEGDQPTLEDLQPLYQAVAHGCQADLQQEACDTVFRDRINRGEESYSMHKLGAFGSELGVVACFFKTPWTGLAPELTEAAQAWILGQAAVRLRALGRLTEALAPMRSALESRIKRNSWNNAARSASNLSELEITLGEVSEAIRDAEQAVTYADQSGDAFLSMAFRTTQADALHQAGRRVDAQASFGKAEEIQAKNQPDHPQLFSLWGFRYCEMLLAGPERAAWTMVFGKEGSPSHGLIQMDIASHLETCCAVSERAAQTLEWGDISYRQSLLDIAFDHLSLGRAALFAVILRGSAILRIGTTPNDKAAEGSANSADGHRRAPRGTCPELDTAVAGFRRAGAQHHLPRGLLTRAWLRFLTGARTGPESAQEDLDEAWEIAERGPMKLHMTDIHLYRARLFGRPNDECRMTKYPWESPAADLAAAEKLINECGYHRRDEELADAKRAILGS